MREKRKYERTFVRLLFTITHESFGSVTVPCRDFSAGGLFVYNDAGLDIPPKGSIIDVQVAGPGGMDDIMQGEIVHIADDGEGFALKFLGIDDEDSEEI